MDSFPQRIHKTGSNIFHNFYGIESDTPNNVKQGAKLKNILTKIEVLWGDFNEFEIFGDT